MSRKKKTQERAQASFKGTLGGKVDTTAIINSLTVGTHKDKVSFTALSMSGEQNEVVTDMVKNERDVLMTISVVPQDKTFPPIQVRGKLKGYKISKTCDSPDVINIMFSSGQVEQITNLIRSEEQIDLTFTEVEPELPMMKGDGEGDKKEQTSEGEEDPEF